MLAVETTNRPEMALEFVKSVSADFPSVNDDAGMSRELFGVTATPTNLVIDREGRIVFRTLGYGPGMESSYAAQVEYLLDRS